MKRNVLGFTLLELLIVISIIGVMATFAVVGLAGAQKTARDNKRKSDLELVRSALELYKADCDTYPALGTNSGQFSFSGAASFKLTGSSAVAGAKCSTSNVYLASIPKDPQANSVYFYNVTGGGTQYTLCATQEKHASGDPTYSCGANNACVTGKSNSCYYQTANP